MIKKFQLSRLSTRKASYVDLLLELLLEADTLMARLHLSCRWWRLCDCRLVKLNLLVLLTRLLGIEGGDDLLARVLNDNLVAAPELLRLRDNLDLLLLLRPGVGVNDKLLDLLLRALLLVVDLRWRAVENGRRLVQRDVGNDPSCHLVGFSTFLLHLGDLVFDVFLVESDRRRCVEDLGRILLNDVGRRNHERCVALHRDELLTVGARLENALDLLLRLNHVLDCLHLRGVCDLVGGWNILQLVLLSGSLVQMQNLLAAVSTLNLNISRLQTRRLPLKLYNRRRCPDRRRDTLDDLHRNIVRYDLMLRYEVLLLNDVRGL